MTCYCPNLMRHTCWKNSEKNVLKGSLFSCVISCFWVAWKYTYFKLRASKAMFFYRKWRLFLERAMSWYNEAICLIVDFLSQIHKLLSKVTFRIFFLLLFSVCFFFPFISSPFLSWYILLYFVFSFLVFFRFSTKRNNLWKKGLFKRDSIYKYTE